MSFTKSKVEKVLAKAHKKRNKALVDDLYNVIFLDFDGVLNLDLNNYNKPFKNKLAIKNLNSLCFNNDFKIVVCSSWRKYCDYKKILYESGLNKEIQILGATKNLEIDRESEILDYLLNNPYIDKFIIIDDEKYNELSKYQVRTEISKGFDDDKYNEAVELILKISNRNL